MPHFELLDLIFVFWLWSEKLLSRALDDFSLMVTVQFRTIFSVCVSGIGFFC